MNTFREKVVLVTGASDGIGRAIAQAFAREGATVVLTARRKEKLEEVRQEIEQLGGRGLPFPLNVNDFKTTQTTVETLLKDVGKIDVLVNNAGISRDRLLLRMMETDWDEVLLTNLKGAFNMTRAVLASMVRNRSGVILNVSSVIGILGNPGQANYAASKAALIAFTKSLAKEVGSRNIRVLALAPGLIDTAMTRGLPEVVRKDYLARIPLRRFGKPEEVADLALFLASERANYLTGQVFLIDGGLF